MSNWKTVFTSDKAYQAEIVCGVLNDRGIHAVVVNKQDRSYRFGHVEVNVDQDSILPAIKIIEDEIKWKDE